MLKASKDCQRAEERSAKGWNSQSFLPNSTCYPHLTGGNMNHQNDIPGKSPQKNRLEQPAFISEFLSYHSIQDHFLLFEMNCGFQDICRSPLTPSHFLGLTDLSSSQTGYRSVSLMLFFILCLRLRTSRQKN